MYRIGIASTDQIVVNQHFGRTDRFYIFEAADNKTFNKTGYIDVTPVCDRGEHNDIQMSENIAKLKQLDCLIVSKVGIRAQQILEQNGISVFEMPGIIQDSIEKVIGFIQVQKLLDNYRKEGN